MSEGQPLRISACHSSSWPCSTPGFSLYWASKTRAIEKFEAFGKEGDSRAIKNDSSAILRSGPCFVKAFYGALIALRHTRIDSKYLHSLLRIVRSSREIGRASCREGGEDGVEGG